MIGSWQTLIKNLLPCSLRGRGLVAMIRSLTSQAELAEEDVERYINKTRLESAVTPQVCWLQKMLTDTLSYPITIQESDGRPTDFRVQGVHYIDVSRAKGIIDRYKLAGRSYEVVVDDATATARWDDYICELTSQVDASATWGDYICEKVPMEISAAWSSYFCVQQVERLRVVDSNNNEVLSDLNFSTEGDLQYFMSSPEFFLILPEETVSIIQTEATVGGNPEPTNANANISSVSTANTYRKKLNIEVAPNTGEFRTWTFVISSGEQSIELEINQRQTY